MKLGDLVRVRGAVVEGAGIVIALKDLTNDARWPVLLARVMWSCDVDLWVSDSRIFEISAAHLEVIDS